MSINFTQIDVDVAGQSAAPAVRFSNVEVDVAGKIPSPQQRFSRVQADIVGALGTPKIHFSRVFMQVLATRTPNFEYTQVVYPDVFPDDISYNSVGSIRFATDVTIVDSGNDQRTGRWDQPLHEYDVAYGFRTMEQLQALIGFFKSMRGRLYAFCYQDWLDYASSYAVAYEARKAPPITPLDQLIGTADGLTKTFQLTKTYSTTSQSIVRPITRPQPGTVLAAIGNAPTTNFTVDNTTGLITFTSPHSVTISGTCTKTASNGNQGGQCTYTAEAGTFLGFGAFIGYYVISSGWVNTLDNLPQNLVSTIAAVSTDGSVLTVDCAQSYGTTAEYNVEGVTVSVNPAPYPGSAITAGFLFYVPVRFDTDTLSMTLQDYGIGGATSVKLIEVRPSSTS